MRRGSIVGWLGAVTAALLLSACGSGTTTMESMANSPSAEGTRSQDATAEADRPAAAPTPAPAGGRPAAAAVPVAADYLWVLTSSGGRVEGVGSRIFQKASMNSCRALSSVRPRNASRS